MFSPTTWAPAGVTQSTTNCKVSQRNAQPSTLRPREDQVRAPDDSWVWRGHRGVARPLEGARGRPEPPTEARLLKTPPEDIAVGLGCRGDEFDEDLGDEDDEDGVEGDSEDGDDAENVRELSRTPLEPCRGPEGSLGEIRDVLPSSVVGSLQWLLETTASSD